LQANSQEQIFFKTLIAIQQNVLDKYFEYLAQGQMVRSRVKWAKYGEKNTKYFLNLEKHHANNKAINELKGPNGIVTDSVEILLLLQNFYANLYSDNCISNRDIDDYLSTVILPKLSLSESKFCDADITEANCVATLNSMSNNKSPGSDGFPAEFYKTFWNDLKLVFLSSLKIFICLRKT